MPKKKTETEEIEVKEVKEPKVKAPKEKEAEIVEPVAEEIETKEVEVEEPKAEESKTEEPRVEEKATSVADAETDGEVKSIEVEAKAYVAERLEALKEFYTVNDKKSALNELKAK